VTNYDVWAEEYEKNGGQLPDVLKYVVSMCRRHGCCIDCMAKDVRCEEKFYGTECFEAWAAYGRKEVAK